MKFGIALVVLFSFAFLSMEAFAQGVDLPKDFETTVYQNDNVYYAQDTKNSAIITSGNLPESVIQIALDRGGDVYVAKGTYNLSQNFLGFNLKSNTYLKLAHDAYLVVPSGYRGHVFLLGSDTFQTVIDGGKIKEAEPVKRNWIGILLQGNAVYFNLVENMVINNPAVVIDLSTSSPDYISGNTFFNIDGNFFVRGIQFDFTGKYMHGTSGIFGNTFRDLQFEGGSMTTYGVKDIRDYNNAFYNVLFWDLPSNAISASVDQTAENTIIIGGFMTDPNFNDKGKNTMILDGKHTSIISNSQILSEILNQTYNSKLGLPALLFSPIYNMSIIQQKPNEFVNENKGQFVTSSEKPTIVNIFGTITSPSGGSVLLTITRPDGVIEENKADVLPSGTFYYPMIFDKNSLTGLYAIKGTYQNSNLGALVLNMTLSMPASSSETRDKLNISIEPQSESNTTISIWFKNNAKLWSQGEINDDVFLNSVQYLTKIGIIENPSVNKTFMPQSNSIPTWFKNNALWWSNDQISDNDFYSTIQYLLNNGLIQVPTQ